MIHHETRPPFMRTHLHHETTGMSHKEIGRVLFSIGLTDRPLSEMEVWNIERRALRKLKRALTTPQKG